MNFDEIKQSIFGKLLFDKKYRKKRYFLLASLLFMYSFEQIKSYYSNINLDIKTLLVVNSTLWKWIVAIIVFKWLIKRYLDKRQIGLFCLIEIGIVSLAVCCDYCVECLFCNLFNIGNARENATCLWTIIYLVNINIDWFIVLNGIFVGKMLKYWAETSEIYNQQELNNIRIESEMLKQQVSPQYICSTLRNCGDIAVTDNNKASQQIILLSHVLRYQLYDSQRNFSLLDSEIKFLRDYFEILKFNNRCDKFSININGNTLGIVVPPMLFATLMNYDNEKGGDVTISFEIFDKTLSLSVSDSRSNIDVSFASRRLKNLFESDYVLDVKSGNVKLQIPLK